MQTRNKMLIALCAVFCASCASNSGVVKTGPETFMVSRQAATGFTGSGTLKAEAVTEAGQYCETKGADLKLLGATEAQPPFIFGNFPKAEISFSCVAKH